MADLDLTELLQKLEKGTLSAVERAKLQALADSGQNGLGYIANCAQFAEDPLVESSSRADGETYPDATVS